MLNRAEDPLYRLSTFIAELHAEADTVGVDGLMQWAVGELSGIIGFDCAWYGWAEMLPGSVRVKASATYNLPTGYYQTWLGMSDQDLLAAGILENPAQVALYDRSQRRQTDGMVTLSDDYGLTRMATAMNRRSQRVTSFFMSGYRSGRASRDWTAVEQSFLQSAVDQIALAMRRCRVMDMGARAGTVPLLVNDDGFVLMGLNRLHEADPMAIDAFADERLPVGLDEIGTGEVVRRDLGLVFRSWPLKQDLPMGVHPVIVRRMEPVDELSPRERQVAKVLASGLSHKEAARHLGVAPATIRNQTQSIYAKLGIDNRASLTALMHGQLAQ